MKKILILTDFSDPAWNALFTALKLHEGRECQFYILHTYEPSFAGVLGNTAKKRVGVLYDSLEAHTESELDRIEEYLGMHQHEPRHHFKTLSLAEDLVDGIQKTVREKEIDLIVMGTKGATGAREVFMGSNTVRVIKKVRNCPILLVPATSDFKMLHAVIFPTDFTQYYDPYELSPLLDLVNAWSAKIIVFQVAQEFRLSPEQDANRKLLEKRLKGAHIEWKRGSLKSTVEAAIMEFIETCDADLIALIHYHHTFMERLTREPVIKKIGFHTPVPMLVLPDL
ncbi:universal stress protein [Lentiprolixibacter aurantiacus]|uniref:Universal stress protein n=1 Tax=Lentiprolixibacter aurantiacus TaxID=2993939 RepID=A0AAE3SQU0_9FLAO|nr:universal stress protein [Lentiprolixibacter aurantiacus]MCX2720752.1 universal stress protein [Lentiprolixibacter aurantiacus]